MLTVESPPIGDTARHHLPPATSVTTVGSMDCSAESFPDGLYGWRTGPAHSERKLCQRAMTGRSSEDGAV